MRPTKETGVVTVAAVRESKDAGIECLFNEREQIFTLSPTVKAQAALAERLEEALEQDLPVRAVLNPRRGVVQRIEPLSERDLLEFQRTRTLVENPDKAVRINVASIDPTTFNIVDYKLKFPVFQLCTRIIPNYGVAKNIFDFCAAQSCHLPGPPTVTPCIPFQYVRDGCYARAHKMRQIIDNYGYCCEKVFSFANQGNDRLAVKADKWGGCCVTWWYHVAPLVRVRIRLNLGFIKLEFVLAMVIDPGMFDKPVLLSTWLAAQEYAPCWSGPANVSMYSIQPGSAYTPANVAGTAFATDPSYTATNARLIDYASFTTCP